MFVFSHFSASQSAEVKYGTSLRALEFECLSSFRLGIGLLVVSAGVNKKSSNISAITGQMPVSLQRLAVFAVVDEFPHVMTKCELIWYCVTVLPRFAFSHLEIS
jgi:hypothetical protein